MKFKFTRMLIIWSEDNRCRFLKIKDKQVSKTFIEHISVHCQALNK